MKMRNVANCLKISLFVFWIFVCIWSLFEVIILYYIILYYIIFIILLSRPWTVSMFVFLPMCSQWPRPFLNMRSCLYLCSCGLVKRHQSSPKYCSNSKFTSSQVQLKSPDVSLLRPFYQGCIRMTCANLRQPGIPECISHQSASVNGRGENRKISKYYCYCVMKCHSKSISGENVVV